MADEKKKRKAELRKRLAPLFTKPKKDGKQFDLLEYIDERVKSK